MPPFIFPGLCSVCLVLLLLALLLILLLAALLPALTGHVADDLRDFLKHLRHAALAAYGRQEHIVLVDDDDGVRAQLGADAHRVAHHMALRFPGCSGGRSAAGLALRVPAAVTHGHGYHGQERLVTLRHGLTDQPVHLGKALHIRKQGIHVLIQVLNSGFHSQSSFLRN